MRFKPATSSTLQESAYEQILEAIVSGELPPGARITTQELANNMSVSMQPIREAIRRLQEINLVQIDNRRIIVAEHSVENLAEFLELRALVEGYAAAKASQRRGEESIEKLQEMLEGMRRYKDDATKHLEYNREFHRCLYSEARMPQLTKIIDFLWLTTAHYFKLLTSDNTDLSPFLEIHEHIVQAIKDRNSDEARKLLEQDVMLGLEVIRVKYTHKGATKNSPFSSSLKASSATIQAGVMR